MLSEDIADKPEIVIFWVYLFLRIFLIIMDENLFIKGFLHAVS